MCPTGKLLIFAFLLFGLVSCRQAPSGKRLITVVDPSASVVDVEYTVNGAGGGAFSFFVGGDESGELRHETRDLPVLEARDVLDLTPRMINGFSGTTRFELEAFGSERRYLLIDRNGDITVSRTLPPAD